MDLLLLVLFAIGMLSGFLGGLLGIGGGVVIVPALVIVYAVSGRIADEYATLIAVATSLTCIVFTSLSAAITQARAGMVSWTIFRRMVAFFIAGAFCAGLAIPYLPEVALRLFIAIFLGVVGIIMFMNWKPDPRRTLPGTPGLGGIGFGGGFVSGTAGIAGGNVIVPTLVFFNVPIHQATATSSAMGVLIALSGAIGYALGTGNTHAEASWMLGHIDLYSGALIVVGAIICAPIGVKTAHRVAAGTLKRVFGLLLLGVSLRMAYTAFTLGG